MVKWLAKLGGWESLKYQENKLNLGFPRRSQIQLLSFLETLFDGFGVSGPVLVRLGCIWSASWVRRRVSGVRLGGVLGLSWGVLGGSWRDPGKSWKLPGSILRTFSKDFLPS